MSKAPGQTSRLMLYLCCSTALGWVRRSFESREGPVVNAQSSSSRGQASMQSIADPGGCQLHDLDDDLFAQQCHARRIADERDAANDLS